MTTKQIRIRLAEEEMAQLQKLADACGVNVTALSAVFVRSAISAIQKNRNRFSMPLEFKLLEPCAEASPKK
jgi:hypothetical protein